MEAEAGERRWGWVVVILALAVGSVIFFAWTRQVMSDQPSRATTYANPVLDRDVMDAAVLPALGEFYLYGSSGGGVEVQAARSPDLVQWSLLPDALGARGEWAMAGDIWAPSVVAGPRRGYLMYYTAPDQASGQRCIGVAVADKPAGPFFDRQRGPIVCGAGGATDASGFTDEDGTRWLLWRDEGGAAIYAQRLTKDALGVTGEAVELLRAEPEWEGGRIGAPTLVKRSGRYTLLYTGNESLVGYATADAVTGPYAKGGENPILGGQGTMASAGAPSIYLDAAGQDWVVYTARRRGAGEAKAEKGAVYLDRLSWTDGRPSVTGTAEGVSAAPRVRR